jgi:hypothetical protein
MPFLKDNPQISQAVRAIRTGLGTKFAEGRMGRECSSDDADADFPESSQK